MNRSQWTEKRTCVLAGILAAGVVAGCGGGTPKLTSEEQSKVAEYRYDFASTVVDGSKFGGTLKGVDYLIALCRKKPTAVYQVDKKDDPLTVRQLVEDGANTLEKYRPELASQLDRVARNGCK